MRFVQLDRITHVQLGESLRAVKGLSLSEEYLQDHFPRFPVMPGVLMLEAMFQAGMWLVRATENFEHSRVVLRRSQNVKFRDLVEPGRQLEINVELKSLDGPNAKIVASGTIDKRPAVDAKLFLEQYNLSDRGLAPVMTDDFMRNEFRHRFQLLCGPNRGINESGRLQELVF